MFKRLATLALVAALVGGCGTVTTTGTGTTTGSVLTSAEAQRAVFVSKTAFDAALIIATKYKNLPVCAATQPQPCSDPGIVAQLQRSANVANVALDAAEAAVRTPQIGSSAMNTAVAAANSALAAFSALVSLSGVK